MTLQKENFRTGLSGKDQDELDYLTDDEYDHLNRNNNTAVGYFIKFLLVISCITFLYLYFTGKL